jgi:hypothetical protein
MLIHNKVNAKIISFLSLFPFISALRLYIGVSLYWRTFIIFLFLLNFHLYLYLNTPDLHPHPKPNKPVDPQLATSQPAANARNSHQKTASVVPPEEDA